MTLKALFYAYVLGGLTFLPLLIAGAIFFAIYTSVPVGDPDLTKKHKGVLEDGSPTESPEPDDSLATADVNDIPKTRKGWLTMRRTFEESNSDGSYVTLVRSFLDARSKDPKKSRPKDMWYVVLKGKVLYLYEDEAMSECEAAIELSGHDVVVYPEGLPDGELFAKRNAICLKPKIPPVDKAMPSVTKEMTLEGEDVDAKLDETGLSGAKREKQREKLLEEEKVKEAAREEALNLTTPWFIFVRSNVEMEDWYFALIHASDNPAQTPTLAPLQPVFQPSDMNHLVTTLDEQPDVIPMRWLNALLGRIFFSFYRTHNLEAYIIGRLMKKLSKVKRPNFLTDIVVTEVSVGDKAPTFSKPMLKELTKEGDASLEVHLQYKGEVRITVQATATINLGARFKSYTVKLVLAAVLRELEGNLLVKVKRPPSNRIWYAFTQNPRMVLDVEPVVSDRQITWGMITSTIESRLKEIIQESVVMPNMDDIAFFESSSYHHRGGIWSDASRRERPASPESPLPEQAPGDDQSTVSAPTPEVPSPPKAEVDSTTIPSSQSMGDLSRDVEPLDGTIIRPSTSNPSDDSTRSARRRSWFSSVRSDDLSALAMQDEGREGSDAHRGRSSDPERPSAPRSQSTPNKPESVDTSDKDSSDESQPQGYLSPQNRRTFSKSSVREHVKSTSMDGSLPNTPTEPSTPPAVKSPDGSRSMTSSPSPSSFLSTLKARDKQALSNQAKETMRKWGVNVNWGGLLKDKDKDKDKDPSGGGSGGDEMPDHGSVGSRRRMDSAGAIQQKARASYAEVRAAVAERRGRDKGHNHPEDDSGSRSTSPIPIPEGPRGQFQANSSLMPNGSSSSSFSASSAGSSSYGKPSSSVDSSGPRVPTLRATAEPAEDPLVSIHSPVHVQPQAKTMTIPGIHASHRGEVQSMGYVAPQLSPPSIADGKLKNASIQSVYRLWKSPATISQSSQESSSESQQESNPPEEADNDSSKNTPISSANAPSASTPRPVPPPLPPRTSRTSVSTVTRPELDPPKLSAEASTAQEILKSIATKDNNTRASLGDLSSLPPNHVGTLAGLDADGVPSSAEDLDSLNTPTPSAPSPSNPGPPLPPRRIRVSSS